jgi:hypothetical protein
LREIDNSNARSRETVASVAALKEASGSPGTVCGCDFRVKFPGEKRSRAVPAPDGASPFASLDWMLLLKNYPDQRISYMIFRLAAKDASCNRLGSLPQRFRAGSMIAAPITQRSTRRRRFVESHLRDQPN